MRVISARREEAYLGVKSRGTSTRVNPSLCVGSDDGDLLRRDWVCRDGRCQPRKPQFESTWKLTDGQDVVVVLQQDDAFGGKRSVQDLGVLVVPGALLGHLHDLRVSLRTPLNGLEDRAHPSVDRARGDLAGGHRALDERSPPGSRAGHLEVETSVDSVADGIRAEPAEKPEEGSAHCGRSFWKEGKNSPV